MKMRLEMFSRFHLVVAMTALVVSFWVKFTWNDLVASNAVVAHMGLFEFVVVRLSQDQFMQTAGVTYLILLLMIVGLVWFVFRASTLTIILGSYAYLVCVFGTLLIFAVQGA